MTVIGTPIERLATAPTVNAGVVAVSPTTTVAAGAKAIMPLATVGTFAAVPTSVSDDAGNTWVIDGTFADVPNDVAIGIASCNTTHAITGSNVVTINYGAAGNYPRRIWILEVGGLTAGAVDQFATASGVSGSAPVVGPTSTLVAASEIAVALFSSSQNNTVFFTPGSGWTGSGTFLPGPSNQTDAALYQIVAATTPVTATGGWSRTDAPWRGLVATYQGVPVSASTVPGPPTIGGRFHL